MGLIGFKKIIHLQANFLQFLQWGIFDFLLINFFLQQLITILNGLLKITLQLLQINISLISIKSNFLHLLKSEQIIYLLYS